MKVYASLLGLVLCLTVVMAGIGCTGNDSLVDPDTNTNTASAAESPSLLKANPRAGAIWADGELFGTVGTSTSFKPQSGNFDELYNIAPAGGAFKDGIGAISESKPGDQDFNGGRWHVNILKAGVDPNKYPNATSVEDLDLNDFVGTSTYFECPLIALRGNN